MTGGQRLDRDLPAQPRRATQNEHSHVDSAAPRHDPMAAVRSPL